MDLLEDPPVAGRHAVWLTPTRSGAQLREVVQHLVRRNSIHESSFALFRVLNESAYQGSSPPLCLDLGANQGHSVVSLHRVCARLRVVCFEPLPWCVESLAHLRDIGQFGPEFSFQVEPCALGERGGELVLWIPGSRSHMLTSQASVDRSRAESEATLSYLQQFFEQPLAKQTVHQVTLPVRKLDDFDLAPHAMKIDVEESELAVLAGAEQTIARHRPLLLIESGPQLPRIIERLAVHGYRPFSYDEEAARFAPYGSLAQHRGNTAFLTSAHVPHAMSAGVVAADLPPWD